jgi:site-specific recombinase XerC
MGSGWIIQVNSTLEAGGNRRVTVCLTCFKALFNYGIKIQDLDVKNPVVGINPFAEEMKIKYIPDDNSIQPVLELCDSEEALLFRFVMDTGARISEALRLSGHSNLTTTQRYLSLLP